MSSSRGGGGMLQTAERGAGTTTGVSQHLLCILHAE